MRKGRRDEHDVTSDFLFTLPERPLPTTPVIFTKSSSILAYSRHRFVNANCRFVISEYSKTWLSDADEAVDWSKVLQVVFPTTNEKTWCSICLEDPVAARITQCGHVYCLPCLVHYLSDDGIIEREKVNRAHKKVPSFFLITVSRLH
jgi:hypothetical protein